MTFLKPPTALAFTAAALTAAMLLSPGAATADTATIDAAVHSFVSGDRVGAQALISSVRPEDIAEKLSFTLASVEAAINLPVSDLVPAVVPPGSTIVILGFGLEPGGALRPTLVERLSKGLQIAQTYPTAPVVVTGGNPVDGRTEAAAMRDWLIAAGVDPVRIVLEEKAVSTAGNAVHTANTLRAMGSSGMVLVTSSDHVRRAAADFLTAGVVIDAAVASDPANLAAPVDPEAVADMVSDARTVSGI